MKFENKVAIITGSTRGIGRATAELFAKEGAKVIIVLRYILVILKVTLSAPSR